MRTLVTGGAGFVGSHVVDELRAHNQAVLVLDNLSTGRLANLSHGQALLEASILDDVDASVLVDVNAVVHCAAIADISRNWDSGAERARLWRTNVDGTRSMLEQAPVGSDFVFVSTFAVNGDESSPYAASKIAGEALVRAYTDAGRVKGRIVRMPSCVGARYTHGHIRDFVRAAVAGNIKVRDDGYVRKPFIHVADAAREIVKALFFQDFLVTVRAGYLWSCRDTLALMRACPTSARRFDIEFSDAARGWIGDPHDFGEAGIVDASVRRDPVTLGVLEALAGLGW